MALENSLIGSFIVDLPRTGIFQNIKQVFYVLQAYACCQVTGDNFVSADLPALLKTSIYIGVLSFQSHSFFVYASFSWLFWSTLRLKPYPHVPAICCGCSTSGI